MGAIFLVTVVGNQLYQKLSSQAFVYSQCMWDVNDISLYSSNQTAFATTVNITKKTWSTEGAWEDTPSFPKTRVDVNNKDFFTQKTCTSSVTHDEWNTVGFGHIFSYDPDVLVESTLTVIRPSFTNSEPVGNQSPVILWGGE
jgi:hypothetical protein